MVELEAQTINAFRRSHKVILIVAAIIGAILIIGATVFFIVKHKNTAKYNTEEIFDDKNPNTFNWTSNEEIQIFRRYLRYETITYSNNFEPCVGFLERQADNLGLPVSVYYLVNEDNPVVVMTWQGSQPELPSIMLNSHMDVVPVSQEFWSYLPFKAEIDESGNIYARGAQDMKPVGMQYLAAIRALKRKGVTQLKRTIHLTYMPDEEKGGMFGMQPFVNSSVFKEMNVGFALDEGYPSPTDELEVYYTEKAAWSVNVTARGPTGHASILFNNTAGEKLNYVINKFLELRRNEQRKLNELNYPYGSVTAINLNILNGGIGTNVVPPEMSAFFDIRLAVDTDWDELDRMINRWAKEAGENVTLEFNKSLSPPPTVIDDSNPYWVAFKNATDELKLNVTPAIFRAATDSTNIRNLNIPVLGFSPLMNTPPMLHEHNEFINADVYLNGIKIYEKIIETIGNLG